MKTVKTIDEKAKQATEQWMRDAKEFLETFDHDPALHFSTLVLAYVTARAATHGIELEKSLQLEDDKLL